MENTHNMNKSLEHFIGKLPLDPGKEIFNFILPDSKNIEFRSFGNHKYDDLINKKHNAAFIGNELLQNKNSYYLMRLKNKKGKYRYYMTRLIEERICGFCRSKNCRSFHCRGGFDTISYNKSKYIGKNLHTALLELYLDNSYGSTKSESEMWNLQW